MKRLVKANSNNYLQPYTYDELLQLIDKAIQYSKKYVQSSHNSEIPKSMSSKAIYSFFVTSDFESGLKTLKKKHKIKELETLKTVIKLLSTEGTVSKKYSDHRISKGYRELKLSEDVLLVYGFIPGIDAFSLSIQFADITNHKNLNKSINKDKEVTKEYINDENFNVDSIVYD